MTPESILHDLSQICSNLNTALDTLKVIVKNYIKLLDTDLFVNGIAPNYAIANNEFLRSLLAIVNQYDYWKLFDDMTTEARQQMFFFIKFS